MNSKLIQEFMADFYGYGNLNSRYWFIGKEEGGSGTLKGNTDRISLWEEFGKPVTVDSISYHRKLGYSEKVLRNIQSTYVKVAQILQILESGTVDYLSMRQYMYDNIGNIQSNHALLELMPLPSRSTSLWQYTDKVFSAVPELKDRKTYIESIHPKRVRRLQELIEIHKPELVMFYSSSPDYIEYWSKIAGSDQWMWKSLIPKYKTGYLESNGLLYFITPHPTSYGIKRESFEIIGHFIKKMLTS